MATTKDLLLVQMPEMVTTASRKQMHTNKKNDDHLEDKSDNLALLQSNFAIPDQTSKKWISRDLASVHHPAFCSHSVKRTFSSKKKQQGKSAETSSRGENRATNENKKGTTTAGVKCDSNSPSVGDAYGLSLKCYCNNDDGKEKGSLEMTEEAMKKSKTASAAVAQDIIIGGKNSAFSPYQKKDVIKRHPGNEHLLRTPITKRMKYTTLSSYVVQK